jgi:hypothetical protein
MRIAKYGTVTFTEGDIKVDGWDVQREDSDPADATNEQLFLAVMLHWAHEKFHQAEQGVVLDLMRRLALKKAVKSYEN